MNEAVELGGAIFIENHNNTIHYFIENTIFEKNKANTGGNLKLNI